MSLRIIFWAVFGLLTISFSSMASALEPVQEIKSPDGKLTAWLIEDHTNPIVALSFSFKGGAALDPVGKEGLARLVAATLDEGAGELGAQAFQGKLQDLSIKLGFSASMDHFSGEVLTLKENLDQALELLRLALYEPRFDQDAIERMRSSMIAALKQSLKDGDTLAAKALYAKVFGNHPYARGSEGTIAGLQEIRQDDLIKFTRNRLAKDNLVIGVTGDITPTEVENLLETVFAPLPDLSIPHHLPEAPLNLTGKVDVIDLDVEQSSILFVQKGIDRHDPDFYPAYVLNYILGGGGFSSRLYEEVREKRGLVYSVYSYLSNLEHADLWMAGAGTQNARVQETLSVVKDEWRKLIEEGVSAEEVANAKTFLTGSFPLRFRSSDAIAAILNAMQRDNLPIDFLETRNQQVEAVTTEAVNRIAKDIVTPDKLSIFIAGRPESLTQ